jgi:hypothetical protein
MIVQEFISNVFEGVNASTDDLGISRRWVYNEARPVRAELIKQEFNKNRLYDGAQAQPLESFELQPYDMATYPVLRSVNKMPKIIECDTGLALDNLYTKSGKTIILTDKTTWLSKKGRRFSRNCDSYGFVWDGYLYVDGFSDLDSLLVDLPGYFDDPVSVGILNDYLSDPTNNLCKAAYEYDFFIPAHIERRVIEIVRSVVLRKLGIPTDIENNDKSDVSNQVQSQTQRLPQSAQI